MTVRRSFGGLLIVLLALALLAGAGWVLVSNRLSELGIEQVEARGLELGWDHLAFRSLAFTWSGANGETVRVESTGPSIHMDWGQWQVDRLATSQVTVSGLGDERDETGPPASTNGLPALTFALPESTPFWLPRMLTVKDLAASFRCGGVQCRLEGRMAFDRSGRTASLEVDATVSRAHSPEPLSIRGDLRLGAGKPADAVTGGELRISGLKPWLEDFFPDADPVLLPTSARMTLSPCGEPDKTAGDWSGAISITTEGGAGLAFEGRLALDTGPPWELRIRQGNLSGKLTKWQQGGWLFDDLRAEFPFSGSLSAASAKVVVGEGAQLRVRYADLMETNELVWLDGLVLSPAGLELMFQGGRLDLSGPVELSAREVTLPGVIPQPWQAVGQIRSRDQTITADGRLSSEAGTTIAGKLAYHLQKDLDEENPDEEVLDGRFSMTLKEANQANHLAGTLEAWPEVLTFSGGQADLSVRIQWPPAGGPKVQGKLELVDASGLYDRMAWQGLAGTISGRWNARQVLVNTDDLRLERLNPGVAIGPIHLAFEYQASTQAPMAGELHLQKATAGFAGGMLKVKESQWSLARELWRVPVLVEGVELSELMNLYPAEGLSGKGTLEGRLPIIVSGHGIRIDEGQLSALPPGGTLELPAEKLRGLGQGGAAMDLVARAMEEFHYQVLDSRISYAGDGTLLLDLHLKGSSPKVESDRPVVLNINLEENVPALLTSLQLSGRVNEAVTKRVRKMLERGDVSLE